MGHPTPSQRLDGHSPPQFISSQPQPCIHPPSGALPARTPRCRPARARQRRRAPAEARARAALQTGAGVHGGLSALGTTQAVAGAGRAHCRLPTQPRQARRASGRRSGPAAAA